MRSHIPIDSALTPDQLAANALGSSQGASEDYARRGRRSARHHRAIEAGQGAAMRLMHKLIRKSGVSPSALVTGCLPFYGAAFTELGLSQIHVRGERKNNRAASSYVPIRRRERKAQWFRSSKASIGNEGCNTGDVSDQHREWAHTSSVASRSQAVKCEQKLFHSSCFILR
jgi:hypothetical protein